MHIIIRLLIIAFIVAIILAFAVGRLGAPLAIAPLATPAPTPETIQATVQAGVRATLTAIALTIPPPTGPRPPTNTPRPPCSADPLPTPGPIQQAFYTCQGDRWRFEGWHFSLGYVTQEGGGCFRLQDGRRIEECRLEYVEEWNAEWQRWDRR